MDDRTSFISEMYKSEVDSTRLASAVDGYSRFVFKSIMGGTLDGLVDFIQTMRLHLSTLMSQIGVFKSQETKKAYYLGMMVALSGISEHAINEQEDRNQFEKILAKHEDLSQMLEFVYSKGAVTHNQLCKSLNKKPSAMTNYYQRVETYSFFTYQKIGTHSLYCLTPKGRRAYNIAVRMNFVSKSYSYEELLSITLSEITKSLAERSHDANKVYLNIISKDNSIIPENSEVLLGELERLLLAASRNKMASIDIRPYDCNEDRYCNTIEEDDDPGIFREANIREAAIERQKSLSKITQIVYLE